MLMTLTEQPGAPWVQGEKPPVERVRACGHQSQRAVPCAGCLRPCSPEPSRCLRLPGAGHLQTPSREPEM